MLTLKVEKRDGTKKPDTLREAGLMPAVFYGKKEESTSIAVNFTDFLKVWNEAGESSVVILDTPDGEKESLIHDVDIDPVSGKPRHADFYVFEKGHKVNVALELEFEGISPAVKDLGGSFVKILHEIKVEAMPKDLPSHLTINIGVLENFGDQILAKDIALPAGVTLEENPEEVIALVSAPREEVEEEVAPVDLSEIEVEKKGKEEETPTESEDTAPKSE